VYSIAIVLVDLALADFFYASLSIRPVMGQ